LYNKGLGLTMHVLRNALPSGAYDDVIFQPGASMPTMPMDNDMVRETTQGTLQVTKDGRDFTAPQGTLWTCRNGSTEMTANKDQTVAIMHVIHLLPG
jgi:hypothetical protein